MNEQNREDLDSLGEIYDSTGLGEALKDGAYGYDFNDEELQNAFSQAKEAVKVIGKVYRRLLAMEVD